MSQTPEEPNVDAPSPAGGDAVSASQPLPEAPPLPPAPPTPPVPAAPPAPPAPGLNPEATAPDADPYRHVPEPLTGGGTYGSAAPTPYGAAPYGAAPYGAPQYGTGQYGTGQYGMPAYGPPGSSFGVPLRTSGKAIGSLVASLLWVCGVGSLVAVVLGHWARYDIKKAGGALGGRGVATAGLVLGYLGLVSTLLFVSLLAVASDELERAFDNQDSAVPAPEEAPVPQQRELVPARESCPDVSEILAVVGDQELVLGNAGRGVEDGVIDCIYVRPDQSAPNLRDYVILAIQDDLTTLSVEEYFSDRELDPPTPEQLGEAAGTAERFGYDAYDAPGNLIPYIDTGAANGERSAVLSVPVSFGLEDPELFAATVEFLEGIRTPTNVI